MSFAAKTDYAGLATTGLELRSNALNKSAQYLQKTGADGSYVADEVFGEVSAPSCAYAVTADLSSLAVTIGKVHASHTASDGKPRYALQSLTISTSAGGEPTVEASCVQIEDNATQTVCVYEETITALTPEWHAQDVLSAFTYSESATLAMQDCTTTVSGNVNVTTINGVPKASDSTAGQTTVSATWWSTSETAPAITAAAGWTISSPLTCTGPDGDMFSWTATATKALTAS